MGKKLGSSFKSYQVFEALFRNAKQNTVFLMDTGGIVMEINTAFSDFFGYKDDDIVGKHFSILFTKEDQLKELPQKELDKVLSTGQCSDNNYLVNKNNRITWVSGESILVKNDDEAPLVLKVIQDIHAQKTYEHSLQHLNEFNERILSAIDDVVIVVNEKREILKSNKSFHLVFREDADSTDFNNLIKPFDTDNDLKNQMELALKTDAGFINKELEIITPADEKRIFDISCRRLEEKDNTRNLLLVMHDITFARETERQREDIIGFVAHELRNPLANIVLCNELLSETLKENKTKESFEFLARSQNNVLRLNKMIAELYDATKIGSGNLQLETEVFNFNQMISEAIETIRVLQPIYEIKLKGSADIKVRGDRYRLIQVVTNYLSNGIKYSNGSDEVELTLKHDNTSVTVSVKDKGLGISKEHLPYIFNRFFRAEKTKNFEGIGLGLYLCRKIIEAHKGKVWVESEEGKGSVFYFSIPI